MFTITQISAIVGLLLAFGVSQPNVDKVQSLLENATQTQVATTTTSVAIQVTPQAPSQPIQSPSLLQPVTQVDLGSTPTQPTQPPTPIAPTDCSQTLQGGIVPDGHNSWMFYGTSTPTVDCPIDPSTQITIQFPQRTSTLDADSGPLWEWMRNSGTDVHGNVMDGVIKKGDSYLFAQGWGYASGTPLLTNTFIWTVGNSSVTVPLEQ